MKITPQIIRELLHYDPETGVLTWRERDQKWFTGSRPWYWKIWNARFAGERAGHTLPHATGYESRGIGVLGHSLKEHHVVWLYMSDDPLPPQIDHKNRDATDNRWENLRASTSLMNAKNKSVLSNSTSGITGVSWNKRASKWRAHGKVNGKQFHLGLFRDLDEAAKVVSDFRAAHGFDPSHGAEIAHYRQ